MTISHEDIKVSLKNNDDGSIEFSHPSYGVISKKRETLESPISLFALETKAKDIVSIAIKSVTIKEDLGDSLYIENETLTEVIMSSSQFIDSFTNMNSSGTPCTIYQTHSKGKIKFAELPSGSDYIIGSVHSSVEACLSASKTIVDDVDSLINVSGNINKDSREEAFAAIQRVSRGLRDGFPHDVSSYNKVAKKQMKEAKASIDLALANKKDKIITKVLQDNPDLLRISDK